MKIKYKYVDGECRTVKKFALLPILTMSGEWIWLEYYNRKEQFCILSNGESWWSKRGCYSIKKEKS